MGMLIFLVLMATMSMILVAQTVHETRTVQAEKGSTTAFYAAQAGTQAALQQLDVLINTNLADTIAAASPSGVSSFASSKVGSGDGIGWLLSSVRVNNVPALLQDGEQAEYAQTGSVSTGDYSYLIIITEKTDPVSAGSSAWDFPFSFEINSSATAEGKTSTVTISGDFTVRLQQDNFARFALFTNHQTMQNGTNVWFTDKTSFYGPVHTNDRFNFALNPGATFTDAVVQAQATARFNNNNSNILLNDDHNGTIDVPIFEDSFTRNATSVSFSSATTESDMANQATGNGNINSDGIYVPANGPNLKGGIYIHGNGTVALSTDAGNNAVYTITQGTTTKKITVNASSNQTTVLNVGTGATNTYNGLPDGTDDAGTLIYATGSIDALSGTVQQDTGLTIASHSDMVITNNVRYQDYTAGSGTPGTTGYVPPSADGTDNLLGLVSWSGNVRIGTAAPNNVEVHGTVMAPAGVFQVDNYNVGGTRGTATLLGGVISDSYGAFGLFNSTTGAMTAGYGRNFVYDGRMQQGDAPPYFPTLNSFVAFTNDIVDKLVWQEGQ